MNEFPRPLSPDKARELRRRQSGKNRALVVVLFLLAALFYSIAIVRFKVS